MRIHIQDQVLALFDELYDEGCQVGREDGYEQGLCPKAEKFYETELSLPLHVNLTRDDLDKVVDNVRRFIG